MKKIILNSIAILGFSFIGFSQDNISIKVINVEGVNTNDNTDYSSGHAAFVVDYSTTGVYDIFLDVENTTGSSKSWRITRYNESDVPSAWANNICIGTDCFLVSSLNPWCSPIGHELNIANDANAEVSFHITATTLETGTFKIYLGDCTNFDDSIEIQMNYVVGVKEVKQAPSFSMYPNPANDLVSIQLNNSKNGTVKIVDLVGNVVYSETISSSKTLNTSEFKNGIYFVTIESEGSKMTSRKLVVKH